MAASPPESLARYADAIVGHLLGVGKGDTLVVQGQPEHRELLVAVAESAYRAGAQYVDVGHGRSARTRARLLHGSDDALGALSPWAAAGCREASAARSARVHHRRRRAGLSRRRPARSGSRPTIARSPSRSRFVRRAQLNLRVALDRSPRWPADHWAARSIPNLEPLEGEAAAREGSPQLLPARRRGREGNERLAQAPPHARRAVGTKLTKLGLTGARAARPGHELDLGFRPARAGSAGRRR